LISGQLHVTRDIDKLTQDTNVHDISFVLDIVFGFRFYINAIENNKTLQHFVSYIKTLK